MILQDNSNKSTVRKKKNNAFVENVTDAVCKILTIIIKVICETKVDICKAF